MTKPTDIQQLTEALIRFRDERDWVQSHTKKDLAISIVLEASELLEHFQWKSAAEIESYVRQHKEAISDEIADVLIYLLQLADDLDIDILQAAFKKIAKNAIKYPVVKARGSHKKYTEHHEA